MADTVSPSFANSYVKHLITVYQANANKNLRGPQKLGIKAEFFGKERIGYEKASISKSQQVVKTFKIKCDENSIQEEILDGISISCFFVGGEKRLCLPQYLNLLLAEFTEEDIQTTSEQLHVNFASCNEEQLQNLKTSSIIPSDVESCGLISLTDAQRLLFALRENKFGAGPVLTDLKGSSNVAFKVYHECFGKCKGVFYPEKFTQPNALCIECCECKSWMSPEHFICHSHKSHETNVCHWGFDSASWRKYLLLARDYQSNISALHEKFEEVKTRFVDNCVMKRKNDDDLELITLKRACLNSQEDLCASRNNVSISKNNFDAKEFSKVFENANSGNTNSISQTGKMSLSHSILYSLINNKNVENNSKAVHCNEKEKKYNAETAISSSDHNTGNNDLSESKATAKNISRQIAVKVSGNTNSSDKLSQSEKQGQRTKLAELLNLLIREDVTTDVRNQVTQEIVNVFNEQNYAIQLLLQKNADMKAQLHAVLKQTELYKHLEGARNLAALRHNALI